MATPSYKIIVNPVAGGCAVGRQWPTIHRRLRDLGLSFDCEFTQNRGHATLIARKAADAGYSYLIAVGGDGTVNEVANGMLSSAHHTNMVLGIICGGTACNSARSLGIPQDVTRACSVLTDPGRRLIDVGEVVYTSQNRQLRRFFVNQASAGLGAAVMDAAKHLPERFGRNLNYQLRAMAAYGALSTHRNKRICLRLDGATEHIRVCYVVVANGQYLADGMLIAPQARPDDGLLNVVTIGDLSKSELLRIVPAAYSGSHLGHPKITAKTAASVTIESSEQFLVEADGEVIGQCPASFSVMPSYLTVAVQRTETI